VINMPNIWIGKVEAPSKVLPNVKFNIKWSTWYLKWPWTKFTIFTKINDKFRIQMDIDTWWFFGTLKATYEDSINNKTKYIIKSGRVE